MIYKKLKLLVIILYLFAFFILSCKKSTSANTSSTGKGTTVTTSDTSLINTAHLDHITVPVTFPNGITASALNIYTDAPDYAPVAAAGEGFTCVDDVARGILFYVRSNQYTTDSAFRNKAYNLIKFVINMQSANGYFYNFLQPGNTINTGGITSIDNPKWWSWRALQALTEGSAVVKSTNPTLGVQMDQAANNLIARIKTDLVNTPKTTAVVNGITIPQWLPEGADQASTLVLALIPYCKTSGDVTIENYIRLLCDGIVQMQEGDATHFPFSCILCAGASWHAYGSEQAHALFQAGKFLNDTTYIAAAKAEVDNFYPYLIQNGYLTSFDLQESNGVITATNILQFAQISYGTASLVFGALDAYDLTGDQKYATMAATIAGWYFGKNPAGATMYSITTGRAYDGITGLSSVNTNAGAESLVEALAVMQRISNYPSVKAMVKNDL